MTVYVDELRPTVPSPSWHYRASCHLTADSQEELHAFARDDLALKRHWYQDDGKYPHYDLTASRRRVAVRLGATEITAREWIKRVRAAEGKA